MPEPQPIQTQTQMSGSKVKVGIQWAAYCGMVCSPVCHDTYGVEKIWIEIDVDSLKKIAKKYRKEYAEFVAWLRQHGNLCNSYDCRNYRLWSSLEFLEKLLTREGIQYVKRSAKCRDAENIELDYSPLEALDINIIGQ